MIDESKKPLNISTTVVILDDKDTVTTRIHLEKIDDFDLTVLTASTIDEAIEHLRTNKVSVLVLDKNLGISDQGKMINGIDYIPEFLKIGPSLQIIVSTGEGDFKDCVEAMRLGAFDFVIKSCEKELLLDRVKKGIRSHQRFLKKAYLEKNPTPKKVLHIGGKSVAANRLNTMLDTISRTNRPVLLLGENGTGKTTVAEALHEKKNEFLGRKNAPFIKVTITNLPSDDIEGEVFGTEKGNFTGVGTNQGLVELADGGTLFLDEIGDLPGALQGKFLEVLQSGTFRRRGGKTSLKSTFQLICATNKDLPQMVKDGTFREDLYHRISPFLVTIPSIRERTEDIPDIIKDILPNQCRENNTYVSFEEIPQGFIEYLQVNPPKGNFRGLQKKIDMLLTFAPRDKDNNPVFKNWEKIPGIVDKKINSLSIPKQSITWKDLLKKNLDIISDPDFPGMKECKKIFDAKLFLDAQRHGKNKIEIAKLLKIHKSYVGAKEELANKFIAGLQANKNAATTKELLQ